MKIWKCSAGKGRRWWRKAGGDWKHWSWRAWENTSYKACEGRSN